MLNPEIQPTNNLNRLQKFLVRTAAGDPETLVRCSQHDTEAVCAVAVIMLLTALYQFSLFTVVGMRLFRRPRTRLILLFPLSRHSSRSSS